MLSASSRSCRGSWARGVRSRRVQRVNASFGGCRLSRERVVAINKYCHVKSYRNSTWLPCARGTAGDLDSLHRQDHLSIYSFYSIAQLSQREQRDSYRLPSCLYWLAYTAGCDGQGYPRCICLRVSLGSTTIPTGKQPAGILPSSRIISSFVGSAVSQTGCPRSVGEA